MRRRIFRSALLGSFCTLLILACEGDPAKVEQPPACTDCYADQDALIQGLAAAYRGLDYPKFSGLFPAPSDSAAYSFFVNDPWNGIYSWDLTEELRIQRRMFDPQHPEPGEVPVPASLWLNSITITLDRTSLQWAERADLYRSDVNPEGLDPARWRASEAEFHADVFWNTQGDTDYRVDGRQNFVVIEDLQRAASATRKFLIYRWEDLGSYGASKTVSEQKSWSGLKTLYS